MIKILISDVVAVFATLYCIWLLKPLAMRVGFVDRPGGRKQHQREVPLIGGIAIFFGFCFALLLLPISLHHYRGLIAGASLLMLIGIVDDFRELGWKLRLCGQILAALVLILWGHHRVINLGDIWFIGEVHLGIWSIPFSTVAIVGFLNAMNMIDGQDGLFGGVVLGQVLLLIFLSLYWNQFDADLLIVLALSILVFLIFNMPSPWLPSASIFIGNSGSTVIAFIVAWFAITIGQRHLDSVKPITILWILSFPVFDFLNVFFHRLLTGRSPFRAGRDHFHHILDILGFDVTISTFLLCLFSLSLGLIGVLFNLLLVDQSWQFLIWLTMTVGYFLFVKLVRKQQTLAYEVSKISC